MKLTVLKLARVVILPVLLGFSWVNAGHSTTLAADPKGHFVGEIQDNWWNVGENTCPHWFMIAAQQIYQPGTTIINEDPVNPYKYSLQVVSVKYTLTGANVPLSVGLPYRIAGANGPPLALRHGFVVIPFRQTLSPSSLITIEIDRWDHGNTNAIDDTGDHSGGDDQLFFTNLANSPCSAIPTPS